MNTVAAACAVGLVGGLIGWVAVREVLTHPTLGRTNVRGLVVPTAGGIAAVLAVLPLAAVVTLHDAAGWDALGPDLVGSVTTAAVVLVAFGLIGLVDDLLAVGEDRGFSGHLRSIVAGRPSTGAIKLVAGGCIAVVVAAGAPTGARSVWMLLADAALVALAANLANLFDRAPGRCTKVSLLALAVLVATAGTDERVLLGATALVVFTMVGLLGAELRERLMLGDTGANPLGAALGVGVVATTGPSTRMVVLVVVLGLNLVSERVSFSLIIAATPGLRHLDELGRRTD